MKRQLILAIFLVVVGPTSLATPSGLTLQGRLVKDEVAVTGAVTLTVSIMSPNADLCYLYQENHSFNLAAGDDGIFSVQIGAGVRSVPNDKGLSLVNVFSNSGTEISGLICAGNGGVETKYTPQPGHSRYVYLSFNTPVGVVTFNDPYVVQSVPYALEAEKLAGRSASQYLQTTTDTTQSKLNDLMVPAAYAELLALLNGSSAQYMTTSNSSPAKLPVLSAPPVAPITGQIWYEGGGLKYFDGVQVKSVGAYTGTTPPSSTDDYGITNAVVKGGQPGAFSLGTSDNNTLTFNTNNTAKMTILGNGNVGIGTTSPGRQLHVYATTPASSSGILLDVGGTLGRQYSLLSTNSTSGQGGGKFIVFDDGATASRLVIDPSGNVGIGTTTPSTNLAISSTGANGLDLRADTGTPTNSGRLFFSTGTAGQSVRLMNFGSGHFTIATGATPGSNSGTEVFRITNVGNVGIGTTTPTQALDISGNSKVSGKTFTNAVTRGSTSSLLTLNSDSNSGNGGEIDLYSSGHPTIPGAITFLTGAGANSERMRIDSTGNVGIGTTTPDSAYKLHVNGNVYSSGQGLFDYLITGGGYLGFQDNTTKIIGRTSGGTSSLAFEVNNGEKIRVTADGKVGIGTTTPGAALHAMSAGNLMYFGATGSGRLILEADQTTFYAHRTTTNASTLMKVTSADNSAGRGVFQVQSNDGASEVLWADASGKVGIGITNPTTALDVVGAIKSSSTVYSSNGSGVFTNQYVGSNGNTDFSIRSNGANGITLKTTGNVGIGTSDPLYNLHVVGTAGLSTGTAWTNASDIRLKDIRGDYPRGLDEILKLHTVLYNYKKDNALGLPSDFTKTGFIAQEVQQVIPEAVTKREDGYLELNVDPIHWAVVNAVKEFYYRWFDDSKNLHREIASVKEDNIAKSQKIQKLEKENVELRERLEKIEKMISSRQVDR